MNNGAPGSRRGPRVSRWCFTENNAARAFYVNLDVLFTDNDNISFICGQVEQATTGKTHFQGYIQLKKGQYLSWLKKNVSKTAHWEVQKASKNEDARDYCRKAETAVETFPYKELGEFTKCAGQRNDLIKFKDAIKNGDTRTTLIDDYTVQMARYPKFYAMVRGMKRPRRMVELKVRLNYGEAGTGKTRYAYDKYDQELYVCPVSNGQMWFDGYDLHKYCLLDDFCGKLSKVSLAYTLNLLDRYPIQLPVKGGFIWWCPEVIIITTNIHPREWYNWQDRLAQWPALKRRIHEVYSYKRIGTNIQVTELTGMDKEEWWTKSGEYI